jgi:hypothetical protein
LTAVAAGASVTPKTQRSLEGAYGCGNAVSAGPAASPDTLGEDAVGAFIGSGDSGFVIDRDLAPFAAKTAATSNRNTYDGADGRSRATATPTTPDALGKDSGRVFA